jgi:hypothetical protein
MNAEEIRKKRKILKCDKAVRNPEIGGIKAYQKLENQ